MAKNHEGGARRGRSGVWFEGVAGIARADLALRRVTGVTVRVRLDADRDRLTCTRRVVTRRTSLRRTTFARNVRRMHELHVEPLSKLSRKLLQCRRRRIHVGVADDAHCLLPGIGELTDVTSDAGVVTGELQIARLALASVTRVALELLVLGNPVRELLECSVRRANSDRFGCFGRSDNYRSLLSLFETACRDRAQRNQNESGFEKGFAVSHFLGNKPPFRTCELE